MLAQLKHFARRFVMMLGGEVLQSAFHFAFNVALVHLLPAWDYGLFAIVMLIGGLALTYMRALAGMPANLLIPAHRGQRRAGTFAVAFGSGALLLAALIGIGVAAGLTPWLGGGALLAGAFIGLWSLRSYLRTALFAAERQLDATISDAVYMASGLVLALLCVRGHEQVLLGRSFAVLAAANLLAIGVALARPRQRMRVSFGRSTRRRYWSMAGQLGWSTVGVTTANIQAQGQVAMIAALAGPAAYAPVAAMVVFFAPMRLIASALANMMQPELAHCVAKGDHGRIRRLLLVWTAAMLAVGLGYGAAMLLALPFIQAPVFAGQPKLLLASLAWGVNAAMLLYIMPRILLEVLRAFRIIAVLTAVSAVIGMALVAVLLVRFGPVWSLVGSVVSEAMVLLWCWGAVRARFGRTDAARRTATHGPLPAPLEAA